MSSAKIKVPSISRPKYDDLIVPYKIVANKSACEVFKMIHSYLWTQCIQGNINFQNACATRMSYALNKGHYKLKLPKKFMDEKTGEPYITAILDMIVFLKNNFGDSDIKFDGNPYKFKSEIHGKKGIILFEIKWRDANGHVTLWDGNYCVDMSDHFVDNPSDMHFWELK